MAKSQTSKYEHAELKEMLVKVANDRDLAAFEALFDHYAPLLRAYSLAREPGAELIADELAQEVMIKIWDKAHTYKPDLANTNTWVFTLARNCRIDYLRKNGRYASNIDPEEIFEQIEDESPGPFQSARQQRDEINIHQCIQELPNEQAEVLIAVYLEGKTHQQVSESLMLPLGTVKSRVRLALKKLELLVKR